MTKKAEKPATDKSKAAANKAAPAKAEPKKSEAVAAPKAVPAKAEPEKNEVVAAPEGAAAPQDAPEKPPAQAKEVELTHVEVRSVSARFRRAGRTWTQVAEVVAKADFSPEQLAALKAERALIVRDVAAP